MKAEKQVPALEHIPALDGLRGYAALIVVISHLHFFGVLAERPKFSGLAVIFFLALSGFLMGHLYLWKPLDRTSLYRYFSARVARVVPVYYIVIIGAFIVSKAVGNNFIYYLDNTSFIRLMTFTGSSYVFWTISAEIQFYFLFVILWWLFASGRIKTYAPLVLFVIFMIFVSRQLFPGFTAFGQLQIFMTGIGVAAVRKFIGPEDFNLKGILFLQVTTTIIVLALLTNALPLADFLPSNWKRDDTLYGHLPSVLACGAGLLSLSISTPFSQWAYGNRLASLLGACSFSLYLLHEPVMDVTMRLVSPLSLPNAANLVLAIAVPVCVATMSYKYIEMPAQRLIRGLAKKGEGRFIKSQIPVIKSEETGDLTGNKTTVD